MYDAAELSQLPGLLAGELASIGRALASTTRENICAILDAAIVRATVSESLAYERLENMLFAEQRGDDAEIERDEALARVAELEAALDAERDAHAWRPVSDDAPAPLEKVVVATRDDPDVAWRLPVVPHLWNTRRGRSLLTQEITGYLSLPPQEPTP